MSSETQGAASEQHFFWSCSGEGESPGAGWPWRAQSGPGRGGGASGLSTTLRLGTWNCRSGTTLRRPHAFSTQAEVLVLEPPVSRGTAPVGGRREPPQGLLTSTARRQQPAPGASLPAARPSSALCSGISQGTDRRPARPALPWKDGESATARPLPLLGTQQPQLQLHCRPQVSALRS